jgi:prolyl-tRNA editing enzyme YbaK/EbsC (Cys-tRNA(Pro) deacylase)
MINKTGFVVHYHVIRHSHTETSPQTARVTGWPKQALIKAVAVCIDGQPALCGLCSHHEVDLELLKRLAGATSVELASSAVLRSWFPKTQARARLFLAGACTGV